LVPPQEELPDEESVPNEGWVADGVLLVDEGSLAGEESVMETASGWRQVERVPPN
jgi:high-affinity K+ transport system ATPase subunit B